MNLFGYLVLFFSHSILASSRLYSNDTRLPFAKGCKTKVCVFKCTLEDYVLYNGAPAKLESINESFIEKINFNDISIYNERFESLINRTIDIILLNTMALFGTEYYFEDPENLISFYPDSSFYLLEDSSLILERPNIFNRFNHVKKYNFCIDYNYVEDTKKIELIWIGYEPIRENNDLFIAPILILSAIFLGLVAVVYALIPTRSMSQFIVQRYSTSQFFGFALLATMQIVNYVDSDIAQPMCKPTSVVVYYFFMSSFLWLNVMSFDIWWSIKFHRPPGFFSKKTSYRYSAYAFGLPLAMSTAIAVVDNTDLSDYPYIVKPNFGSSDCFFEGGERFLYFYMPLIIILLTNALFFIMTAVLERRVSRRVLNTTDNRSSKKQRNIYVMYVKLSVVMGLNWILELASLIEQEHALVMIADICNTALIGLAVFLLFVCNKNIIKELSKRFPSLRRILPKNFYRDMSMRTVLNESTSQNR